MRDTVLEQNPSARLRVYVVWLPMRVHDARSEIDTSLIDDRRARHYWDEERVSGTWFAEADLGGLGYAGIVWDAYFLFSVPSRRRTASSTSSMPMSAMHIDGFRHRRS